MFRRRGPVFSDPSAPRSFRRPIRPDACMNDLPARYRDVRHATLRLVEGLDDADLTTQSAEFASPGKWHLAHTTWFFEQFVLAAHGTGYRRFDERFGFLFNSYYNAVGARHERPRRGLLTRPSLA